jgi:hypothetical protein
VDSADLTTPANTHTHYYRSCPMRKIRIPMSLLEESHNPKRVEEDRSIAIEAAIVRIMKVRSCVRCGVVMCAAFVEACGRPHFDLVGIGCWGCAVSFLVSTEVCIYASAQCSLRAYAVCVVDLALLITIVCFIIRYAGAPHLAAPAAGGRGPLPAVLLPPRPQGTVC